MDTSLNRAATRLATGEILRVDGAIGQSIAVLCGMVWITEEGDPRDTFLGDGESFTFTRRGTALAQAITDTSLIAFVGEAAEVIEIAPAPIVDEAISIIDGVRNWVRRLPERYLREHCLAADLPEWQLRDIGLERDFVGIETARPFWRA